ncbi:MAG: hypothetical protein A2073_00975 [Deltaproteobacteria bacterium GWC2_42_11]|nr:MAG: hypothetical protein A2073_00975 [Deltaproteobacteria bacterium GWC2_42_11]
MKVVDSKTMKLLDEKAIKDYGIPGIVLMENAGKGAAEIILKKHITSNSIKTVSIFAGKGNNGGDGFVIARHLKNKGMDVIVYLVAKESDVKGDAGTNMNIWKKMGGKIYGITKTQDIEKHASKVKHSQLIIDAIFGTGFVNNISGIYKNVIDFINGAGKKVVSIDVPSGIDASTGRLLGCCIKADATITMVLPKIGLITYPGAGYAGKLDVVDIGMPLEIIEDKSIKCETIEDADIKKLLKKRPKDSHKGIFGHLLVLSGSTGKTGAAAMTCLGAMRVGTGLVTLGIPESLNRIMEEKLTEVMTEPLPETKSKTLGGISFDRVKEVLKNKQAIAIGPGMTAVNDVRDLVLKLIKETNLPIVIDADAINVLKGNLYVLKQANVPTVMTPHPGEMARLLDLSTKDVQADRINTASGFATENNVTLVLKGARTVIASPDGMVYINMTGNAGMATAGTGDILTGMIAGFMAQGYLSVDAARIGVYLHGLAGDTVARKSGEIGMMATDLLTILPEVLNSLLKNPS